MIGLARGSGDGRFNKNSTRQNKNMSWSIKSSGRKEDVAAVVRAQLVDNGTEPGVGKLICDQIAALPSATPLAAGLWYCDSVAVVGWGHNGGGIGKLEIEPYCQAINPANLIPPPTPAAPEPKCECSIPEPLLPAPTPAIEVEPAPTLSPTASGPAPIEDTGTSAPPITA